MQVRRKLLIEFLLSIGLVFSLSRFFLTQTFFLEERLQSVAIIALILSLLVLALTFFRYLFLIAQTQLNNKCHSEDACSVEFRLPTVTRTVACSLQNMPSQWKTLKVDEYRGYVRFRRPIHDQSWGEIIEIHYEPLDSTTCWVTIKSSSIDPQSKQNSNYNLYNVRTAEQILQRIA